MNSQNISNYGITALQFDGQNLATTGEFDMPARTGETEHNWGTETEAFTDSEDMTYGNKEISFRGIMKATSRAALLTQLANFTTLCKNTPGWFETHVGQYYTYLKGGIEVQEITSTEIILTVHFLVLGEPFPEYLSVFPDPPTTPTNPPGDYLLNGYHFKKDLGIIVSKSTGRMTLPPRIEIQTTAPYLKTGYPEPAEVRIECTMIANTLPELKTATWRLQLLLATPGLLVLTYPDGSTAQVYNRDGFRTSIKQGIRSWAQFTLILRKP